MKSCQIWAGMVPPATGQAQCTQVIDCCTPAQRVQAYAKIREFLTKHRVLDAGTPSTAQ